MVAKFGELGGQEVAQTVCFSQIMELHGFMRLKVCL